MATERIESLISKQAIDDFDILSEKLARSIAGFEKLIENAAALNRSLSNSKNITDISKGIDEVARKEKDLAKSQKELAATQEKLVQAEKRLNEQRQRSEAARLAKEEEQLRKAREKSQQQELGRKEKELIEQRKKSEEQLRRQNLIITENLTLNVKQGVTIDQLVDTYNRYKLSLDAIQSEIRDLNTSYKNGAIALDEYNARMRNLKVQEEQQKVIVQNLGNTIKDSAKQNVFASNSAEQLRAKLALLTKTYDNLSRTQQKSDFGKQLKKQVRDVTDSLSQLEQGTGRFNRNVGNYSSAFKGYAASLGALLGVGSALEAGRQIFEVNRKFDELNKSIELVSGSSEEFATNQDFLKRTAESYGLEIESLSLAFKNFYAASTNAGLSADQTRNIFDSVSKVAGNLKLSQENVNGVLLAFGQIASKGKVQAEELRGQIGERIPGAFAIAARAIGVTQTELNKMMEQGLVPAAEFLPKFAAELERTFGRDDQVESLTASINRFFNIIKQGVQSQTLVKFLSDVIETAGKSVAGLLMMAEAVVELGNRVTIFLSNGLNGSFSLKAYDIAKQAIQDAEEFEKNQRIAIEARINQYNEIEDSYQKQLKYQEQIQTVNRLTALFEATQRNNDKQGLSYARERLKYELAILKGIQAVNTETGNINQDKKRPKIGVEEEKRRRTPKFFDQDLKIEVDQLKKISEVDSFYLDLRINARKIASEKEQEILKGNYNTAKNSIEAEIELNNRRARAEIFSITQSSETQEEKAAKIAAINLNLANSVQDGYDKISEIDKKYASDRKQLEQDLLFDLVQIRKQFSERVKQDDKGVSESFVADQKTSYEKQIATLVNNNEKQIQIVERTRDIELTLLNEKYTKGLLTEEKYAREREKIERDSAISVLKYQIEFTEKYIELARMRGEDTTDLEAKLASLKKSISGLFLESEFADNQVSGLNKLLRVIDKVKEAYDSLVPVIAGAIQAGIDKRKNAIQEEIDLNDKRTKAEIEAINASTLSQQEKADRISVLNARNQAQKEQLERRQRLLDQQRAKFDKAAGIGAIVINTARGVTAALASIPPNLPLAFAIGALGAAQLAVAAATPIPKFAQGTMDAPGGPAIVGDGGRKELVVTPEGRLIETPAIPTVMNVPKHSIIFPDARKVSEKGLSVDHFGHLRESSYDYTRLEKKLDVLNRTIKNKETIQIHNTGNGWKTITSKNGSFFEKI